MVRLEPQWIFVCVSREKLLCELIQHPQVILLIHKNINENGDNYYAKTTGIEGCTNGSRKQNDKWTLLDCCFTRNWMDISRVLFGNSVRCKFDTRAILGGNRHDDI